MRILKGLRASLIESGAEFRFGCKVKDILQSDQRAGDGEGKYAVKGVLLSTGERIDADVVVLAVGHSARKSPQ